MNIECAAWCERRSTYKSFGRQRQDYASLALLDAAKTAIMSNIIVTNASYHIKDATTRSASTVFLLTLGYLIYHILYQICLHPLRSVPDPFAARFTRFRELYACRGNWVEIHRDLHQRYGPRRTSSFRSRKLPSSLTKAFRRGRQGRISVLTRIFLPNFLHWRTAARLIVTTCSLHSVLTLLPARIRQLSL